MKNSLLHMLYVKIFIALIAASLIFGHNVKCYSDTEPEVLGDDFIEYTYDMDGLCVYCYG